jgi:hypothetical protein
LRQALEEKVDQFDFSGFWQGVEEKLIEQKFPWTVRLRLWGEQWRPQWTLSAPAWAAATVSLVFALGLLLPHDTEVTKPTPSLRSETPTSTSAEKPEPFELASNQAQIESLFSTDPVMVWNDPVSNATVIWVGDEGDGGLP